nr:hypothetical protein TorRG33x02_055670 [Ipomoea batatas]
MITWVTNLSEIKADGASSEGVGVRLAAVFLVRGSEAPNERVEATPGLPERAGARRRRVGMAVEGTDGRVDFRLPKLVEIPEKFQHVSSTAPGERERRPVVFQDDLPTHFVQIRSWNGFS